MDPHTALMLTYAGLTLAKQINQYLQDQRTLNPAAGLPPIEPLPEDLHAAAVEYAKAHNLPLPGGEAPDDGSSDKG